MSIAHICLTNAYSRFQCNCMYYSTVDVTTANVSTANVTMANVTLTHTLTVTHT